MKKGKRLKQLRVAKGLTQIELAQLLHTTKQTVSKYENSIVTNIPSDRNASTKQVQKKVF